jgi:alkylation response protein AidB-like acyl-CoA dehydrogenase
MDLELTDEQRWIAESVDTLLDRLWPAPESLAEASPESSRLLWRELVEFGALTIGDAEGLGAVELCLIARSLGAHLATVPFLGSAAARLALPDPVLGDDAIALAVLEPGSSWLRESADAELTPAGDGLLLEGRKVAVEQPAQADRLAVSATLDGARVLALVSPRAPAVVLETLPSFDPSVSMAAAVFDRTPVESDAVFTDGDAARRLITVGALLAAAEGVGAASAVLELARRYAAERRQFGRTIGSFQSLRHVLADMYVQQASGWSAVLYGAASFDDATEDAEQVVSIAKAYVSRTAREVAHGAMQVFGGIAFTAEHPAHRFLRRIVLREQQFGDATDHERELGRRLAQRAAGPREAVPAEAAAG